MPNKFSVGCQTCDCPCEYAAATGSTYSDTFSNLSGWTQVVTGLDTWQAASNHAEFKNTNFGMEQAGALYREDAVGAGTSVLIRAEVEFGQDDSTTRNLSLGINSGKNATVVINLDDDDYDIQMGVYGNTYSPAPTSGTFQITMQEIDGGGSIRACWYLDGQLIDTVDQVSAGGFGALVGTTLGHAQGPNGTTFYGYHASFKLDIVT